VASCAQGWSSWRAALTNRPSTTPAPGPARVSCRGHRERTRNLVRLQALSETRWICDALAGVPGARVAPSNSGVMMRVRIPVRGAGDAAQCQLTDLGTSPPRVGRQAATRSHLAVAASQVAAVAGFVIVLATDAPPPFSPTDWLFAFAPPLVFAMTWMLGRRMRVAVGAVWVVAVASASSAAALTGLVVTTLYSRSGCLVHGWTRASADLTGRRTVPPSGFGFVRAADKGSSRH
jgi:hypothetical protein